MKKLLKFGVVSLSVATLSGFVSADQFLGTDSLLTVYAEDAEKGVSAVPASSDSSNVPVKAAIQEQDTNSMDVEAIIRGDYSSVEGTWEDIEGKAEPVVITEHGPFGEAQSLKNIPADGYQTYTNNGVTYGRQKTDSSVTDFKLVAPMGFNLTYISKGNSYSYYRWSNSDQTGTEYVTETATEDLLVHVPGAGASTIYKRRANTDQVVPIPPADNSGSLLTTPTADKNNLMDVEAIKQGDYSSVVGTWVRSEKLESNEGSKSFSPSISITEHGPFRDGLSMKDLKLGEGYRQINGDTLFKYINQDGLLSDGLEGSASGILYTYIPKGQQFKPNDYSDTSLETAQEDLIKFFVAGGWFAYYTRQANTEQTTPKTLTSTTDPVTVKVSAADSNTIARIETSLVTDQTLLANLPSSLPKADTVLYSIKTVDDKGNFVQINDKATVTLAVDPDRTVDRVVYYLPINGVETGAKEELKYTVSDDKKTVSFDVTHFSYYGVVYASENSGATTPNPTVPVPPQTPPTNNGGTPIMPPATGNNGTTSPAPQAPDLSPVREQLLAQIDQSNLTDEQKGALAEQIAFAETAKALEAIKAELAKLTAPAPVTLADLSTIRNQLLTQVDKSNLTDEQKGELAVQISLAETAAELDKLKAEFAKLTKPATPATPAAEATKATAESKNTLPKTGDASSLALTGLGLVTTLASLGLAHRRQDS